MAIKIFNSSEQTIERVSINIYGESGVGKTSLALSLNEPTLIIDVENGTLCLRGKAFDVVRCKTFADIAEVMEFLATPEAKAKYKNVFFDSLTEANKILIDDLSSKYPDKKDTLKKFGEASEYFTAFIRELRDLEPYNVFMTAHVKIDKDEDNRRFITTGLVGKLADSLPYFFDEVFCLKIFRDPDGKSHRKLITSPYENITAKDRSGSLEQFEEPNLQAVLDKVFQKKHKTKK